MEQKQQELHGKLLEKCKKGDAQAQYRLYKMYAKALYNSIYRIVLSTLDAEDLLQETFIKAFKSIRNVKDSRALFAWLKRIAVNEALGHKRLQKISFLQVETHIEEMDFEDWPGIPMEILQAEIQSLPEGCRIVFNLFLLEDYSHKEIAELLKISESTSKTQYRRAKQLLQERLKKHYERG